MQTSRHFFPIFFALLLIAAAARAAGYPLTVTDDGGNRITLATKPARIASLTLFTDEVLLELVDPARLVAVTVFAADPSISNVAEKAARIPRKLSMNVEVLVALKPDLVVAATWSEADKVRQLRDAGIPVYLTSAGITVDQVKAKIARVGELVGEPAGAGRLLQSMEAQLAAVEQRLAKLPSDRRLSVVDYTVWGAAQGKGSSWDEIVRRAGLVNGAGSIAADEWGQVPLSKEKLLEIDPDILILPGWTYGDPKGAEAFFAKTTADPVLGALKAVRNGRAYRMPENLKTTTSHHLAGAVEWLARTAYPELFR